MKKRLLITSIVMMLVVAVALSTATYAWFTSNSGVKANSITLKAATNDAPSLGISWVDGNYGTELDAVYPDTASKTFSPAAPVSLVDKAQKTADDSLTLTTTGNVTYKTALATPGQTPGDMFFLADGAVTDVYTWNDGDGTGKGHTSFFLKNLSPSNSISSITLTPTITGAGADLARIGVFIKNNENYELLKVLAKDNTYTYTQVATDVTLTSGTDYYKLYLGKYVLATAGTAANVALGVADYEEGVTTGAAGTFFTRTEAASRGVAVYGEIESGESVNDMEAYECATSVVVAQNLAHDQTIELVVKVWLDAVALGDAEQGQEVSIVLNFAAV